jgi:hypothetical protein
MIRIITFMNAGESRAARLMLADAKKCDVTGSPERTLERPRAGAVGRENASTGPLGRNHLRRKCR